MNTRKTHTPNPDTSDITGELFPGGTTARTQMSKAVLEITNRRYQDDEFWAGPKGLEYGLLVGAMPVQNPVLYPDQGSTYFIGQFQLPEGASLTIRGEYPHLRYFSYTVATQLRGGGMGNGDFLRDVEILPDVGSTNPFVPSNPRDATPRRYTLHVVQGDPPEPRAPNTIYTGSTSYEDHIHLAMRNYIPDAGYDGTGNVELDAEGYGLPRVELNLPNESKPITGRAMCEIVRVSKKAEANEYSRKQWLELIEGSSDPTNAPATPTPAIQRFWNTNYNVTGSFILDPEKRVLRYPATNTGGFANNPDTVFMYATFSLDYGRVVVVHGKMPTHQTTRHHNKTWTPDTNVRYWSATSGGSAPSGAGWQSVFDEQVPVDANGNFTLVMSWLEDRPANATTANGVIWLDFGSGEGHYVGARNWVNILYLRYMNANPDWPQSPSNIPNPTPEHPRLRDEETMQEYYPKSTYMTKEAFEKFGPQPWLRLGSVFGSE